MLRPDHTGSWVAAQRFVLTLQADMSRRAWVGSVAALTSDSALAQAHELTSHIKEKITVTIKSCLGMEKYRGV